MAFKFNDFVTEANRRNKKNGIADKPFEVDLGENRKITLQAPDATTYLALSDVEEGQTLKQFRILFGNNIKDYNAFIEALDGQPMAILTIILEEAFNYWGAEVPAKGKSES